MEMKRNPWSWIPSLYMAESLPYVAVMTISVIMYKRLGISNTDIAFSTGWLYLPWVIKPFWSPFVDLIKTKRWWTVTMQFLIAIAFACIAFSLPTSFFFQFTLAAFWLVAFTSATHDIAADGYYMHALDDHEQSLYVGIRSTFYRIATVAGQGLLVILAGFLEEKSGNIPFAWSVTFFCLSALFFLAALYHQYILPRPATDHAAVEITASSVVKDFLDTFKSFFTKRNALVAILFMLLYRLPEAQLVKMITPFMLDPVDKGGLGLTTSDVGFVYGTVGIIGLTIGGILGGIAASRGGLKRWLWPMVCAITLPDLVYVYLSYAQPDNMLVINSCVFIEQFGYGFGFTAYMLYLIYFSEGSHKTAHYAICTGFMALGMMLPGMVAGKLQETIGYQHFFVWTIICCLATFVITAFLKIDPEFGKKNRTVAKHH
ncbi:MAG: MFS transporter [Bacteroidaceae bacterium]|nr:MFS transporter [Bacteroidaceae bacterium]